MARNKKTLTPETPAVETPAVSQHEMVRAALNAPELSEREFKLGDKVYKVIDLEYDDYLMFVELLTPLFEMLQNRANEAISVPDIALTPEAGLDFKAVLKYCKNDLPELVRIICRQTDPDITVEQIKKAGNPIKLANIVLQQILQNNMIQEFADFFVQMIPLMRAVRM
jgi:hypothetical protein